MKGLKLSAPLAGPALDDDFGLGVEFHPMPSLRVQVAEKAVVPAAEGEERHGGCHPDVDAHVPRVGLVAELARSRATAGEDTGHVAVAAAIHQRYRLVNAFGLRQTQHRPENLRPRDLAARVYIVQHRR